jgi:hypothetical protein
MRRSIGMSVCAVVLVACASAEDSASEVPSLDTDAVEGQQVVTSINADGTWTADAWRPGQETSSFPIYVRGGAHFAGPAGKTRRMGVCGLQEGKTAAQVAKPCTTASDCSDAPATLPAGGFRYCTAPEGIGQKYCYFRPGPPSTFCAGTPANGGVPIAPAYLETPSMYSPNSRKWISYACFEGCAVTDPSSSSQHNIVVTCPTLCGGICCRP